MIDKPLYGNPLGGGALSRPQDNQLQGDALVERMQMRMQQRDQKTPAFLAYFKDVMDTKGYPTKTMEEYGSITKQKGPLDLSKINKNPYNSEFIGIGADQTNLFGYKVPDYVIKEQEERMKNNPINNFNMTPLNELELLKPLRPKSDDPLVQGYMDSDFYESRTTANVVPFTYKGKEMTGSGSYASNFKKYLDSIGKGDLIQFPDQSESLTTVGSLVPDNNAFPASPGFTPLPTIPKAIVSPGLPPPEAPSPDTIVSPLQPMSPSETNPYQEQFTGFQNQLTGFNDQFSSMGDRLTKLEEGIASLLNQNRGFGFNSMQPRFGAPNYGFSPFSMVGLGSLFGGYYG